MLSLVGNAGAQGTGTIMREVWEGIGGTSVSDLTGNANFPDNPSYGDLVTLFETPTDFADNFGSRVSGWLHPETSGDYTFWIATDDGSELWLSTSDDPADAVLIAFEDSWTGSRSWQEGNEKSAPISLTGGEKYYIMAMYKEGGGGDNLAVAWEGPDCPARDVIDGYFLSPAQWAAVLLKASAPVPADGTVDADVATLEWTAGPTAVSHKVYFSTDETIDEADLAAETEMTMHFVTLDPGATCYWRVDEVDADGVVFEGNLWSFTTLPMEAHFPSPSDGAKGIESGIKLSWAAGKNTIMHNVSFGTDPAALIPVSMMQMGTSYDPGPLEQFTTYYWKVDEFTPVGTVDGPVWSFSMAEYIIIDSEETTLDYDNSVEPYFSEVALDTPADLTTKGVSDLTLLFHGAPGPEGSASLDEATGTYTIVGSGADIWGNSDQFHYAYRELTGDATMIARVADNGSGTNEWAKGGVMIRQSLDAGSTHRYMPITAGGGNGASFQGRPVADAASNNVDSGEVVAPPYWVKLERVGNDFTGSISPDGITWTQLGGAETVEMTDPVLIGLAVTSHQSGEKRTFTFDNVDIVGNISADDASTDIGIASNSAEPIYVVLEDSSGAVAMVAHPYPAATRIDVWRPWTIPLSKFAGVDLTAAAKLYIGVGDGEPGGSGTIRIDDIYVVKPDPTAGIANWEVAVAPAAPGFLATNVADDLYDIGAYSGDITYEFVVRSNPDETEASMCLIGRRQFGDTEAGLKYEQWNNTGTYGATLFGVVDLDFGIATNPGVDTHLVFVSSEDAATTALYVNGVYQASVDNAITLSGLVGIGYGAQGADASDSFDNFDGDIFCVAIYDTALSDDEIAAHSDAFLAPLSDVTAIGDIVQGVPDDGDWPGGEPPAFAIDDNTGTKYLHFKGDFDVGDPLGGAGFRVTPLDGASIVTGLTFTTANDSPERDPVAFGFYGSNVSIDGPYEMIAIGDIVDFDQETAWPRYTKNETPISFENDVAYDHYQVLFLAIRDVGTANSMQIAEVELLSAPTPLIAWVSYHAGDDEPHADAAAVGFTQAPDIGYTDLLKAQCYDVIRYVTTSTPDVELLNTMDLVIISRTASSGHYSGGGATLWNSVTAPMINLNGYTLRSSRLGFTDGTDMPDTTGDITLTVTDPTHPIFAGIDLIDGTMVNPFAEGAVPLPTDGVTLSRGISINYNNLDDEGTVLATIAEVSADTGPVGGIVIAELPAGATMENSSGSPTDVLGGPRLVFLTGSREPSGVTGGQAAALYDLYEDGTQMFLNAVEYMLP